MQRSAKVLIESVLVWNEVEDNIDELGTTLIIKLNLQRSDSRTSRKEVCRRQTFDIAVTHMKMHARRIAAFQFRRWCLLIRDGVGPVSNYPLEPCQPLICGLASCRIPNDREESCRKKGRKETFKVNCFISYSKLNHKESSVAITRLFHSHVLS